MGEENGNPLQYSCLENSVDRGAWRAAVHRVSQSQIQLKWLSMHACIGEGNGNPLQRSCLENPRDRRALWAAVYGVPQSWTWLKWLNSNSMSLSSIFLFIKLTIFRLLTCPIKSWISFLHHLRCLPLDIKMGLYPSKHASLRHEPSTLWTVGNRVRALFGCDAMLPLMM